MAPKDRPTAPQTTAQNEPTLNATSLLSSRGSYTHSDAEMSHETHNRSDRMPSHWPFTISLAVFGAILLISAIFGLLPVERVALLFSDDGQLTESFRTQLFTSQWVLGALCLAGGIASRGVLTRLDRGIEWLLARADAQITWISAVAAGSISLGLNLYLYDGIPHVTDEISHLFQAKILLTGHLAALAPACPMSFYQPHIIITASGLWHSIYPPGHALLAALFMLCGGKLLLGPVCTAIAVAALHRIALRFWCRPIAHTAAVLFALSPQVLLLGGSWMSHSSFLAMYAAGWALWLFARTLDTRFSRGLALLAAGLLLAWSAIIRPQDFLLASAIPALAAILYPRQIPALLKDAGFLLIGALPVIIFTAIWNTALNGAPLALGYGHSASLTPQMRPTYGFSSTFGFEEASRITVWSLIRLNKSLLGWPSSFIALFLLALAPRSLTRRDAICIAGVALVIAFFFFYFYYGSEYEARFYFTAVPLLIVLTAKGLQISRKWLSRGQLALLILIFTLHGTFFYWPSYVIPRYRNDYEQVSRVIAQASERQQIQHAVVLVPADGANEFRFSGAFMWNDPQLTNKVIYVREIAADRDCLRNAFPTRTWYRFVPENNWRSGRLEPVAP